ncbi:hypothetical protein LCGC14_2862820, partial [marine sediment metagenome]
AALLLNNLPAARRVRKASNMSGLQDYRNIMANPAAAGNQGEGQ